MTICSSAVNRPHRKTADQLKRGTYFLGKEPSAEYEETVYLGGLMAGKRYVLHTPSMLKSSTPADKWEVLEEYGPFQKPEEKK